MGGGHVIMAGSGVEQWVVVTSLLMLMIEVERWWW